MNLSLNSTNCVGGLNLFTNSLKIPLISIICATSIVTGLNAFEIMDKNINDHQEHIVKKEKGFYFEIPYGDELKHIIRPINKIDGNVEIGKNGKLSLKNDKSLVMNFTDKNGKKVNNVILLELGENKQTELTIKDGGVLEITNANLIIGETFDKYTQTGEKQIYQKL